jgi:hypothetical protein
MVTRQSYLNEGAFNRSERRKEGISWVDGTVAYEDPYAEAPKQSTQGGQPNENGIGFCLFFFFLRLDNREFI